MMDDFVSGPEYLEKHMTQDEICLLKLAGKSVAVGIAENYELYARLHKFVPDTESLLGELGWEECQRTYLLSTPDLGDIWNCHENVRCMERQEFASMKVCYEQKAIKRLQGDE